MIVTATERLARCQNTYYHPNNASFGSKNISIRAATTTQLNDIYEFRYEVYLNERSLPQFYADHTTRQITDPLDPGAHNLVAYQGEEVVGTLRVNFARDTDISYYESFLEMRSAGEFHPLATSLSTRFLVAPRLRGTSLAIRLSQAAYALGLRHGIRYNFLDCDRQMARFFERLGYVFQKRARHPEYGVGDVMRLDLLDRRYLAQVRSPFLTIFDKRSFWTDGGALVS